MIVAVSYHGPARDWAGVAQESVELPDRSTLATLTKQLFEAHAELAKRAPHLRVAVNLEFVKVDTVLHDGDSVAMIPPVSGGSKHDLISLTPSPIDTSAVHAFVSGDPRCGGTVTFEGTTRAEQYQDRGGLVRLEYEAHNELAAVEMERIVSEARGRWPIGRVAMVHRIGPVEPGAASVVIAVACAHRNEAFEACRWLIDSLKSSVPIWKREIWTDGPSTWVEPPGDWCVRGCA